MPTPEEEPTTKQDEEPTINHTTNVAQWNLTTQNKTISATEKKTQKKILKLQQRMKRLMSSVAEEEFFNICIAQAED